MIILLWKLHRLFTSFNRQTNLYDQEKNETVLYIVQGPGIPFGFNTLSFLALHISSIPIENVLVSSGLNLPFSKDITNKENFQYQKWDLNKVIKSVIMMIMMKNIKKMDPRLKEETVNEIFKKENNKKKSETSN